MNFTCTLCMLQRKRSVWPLQKAFTISGKTKKRETDIARKEIRMHGCWIKTQKGKMPNQIDQAITPMFVVCSYFPENTPISFDYIAI
jgi:hypothetical protein